MLHFAKAASWHTCWGKTCVLKPKFGIFRGIFAEFARYPQNKTNKAKALDSILLPNDKTTSKAEILFLHSKASSVWSPQCGVPALRLPESHPKSTPRNLRLFDSNGPETLLFK